jgi:LacI family transcriptional regulator
MQRPPSQLEVARSCGVSQKTVSLALNNDPRISAGTRAKINAAAKRLGYQPNPLLTALMTNIRRRSVRYRATIGVLICQSPTLFRQAPNLGRSLRGIYQRARQLGYSIEEFWVNRDGINPDRFHKTTYARNINGLIIMTPHDYFDFGLDWSRFATAGIGCASRYPVPIHNAFTQSFRLVRSAWKRLQSLGFRRIGLAASHYQNTFLDESLAGPYYAQQSLSPPADRVPILLEETCTPASLVKWYRRHRPEVILCHSSAALDWLRNESIRVPEDVSLVHLAWYPKLKGWATAGTKR